MVGQDRSGFYDVLISHGGDAWQVKEYQVNPYKYVGLGSKLPGPTPGHLFNSDHPFGFRPIGLEQMKELANIIEDPRAASELAAKLLVEKPVSFTEAMESPAVLHGPVLHSARPIEALSTSQTKLDEKLRKELQRIVLRDYRHTITPYI